MQRCLTMLQEGGLTLEEAKSRLSDDLKFSQQLDALKLVGKETQEEKQIERSLCARAKIIVDSHLVSQQVSTPWEEARDILEKSKRYRKTLGSWLASRTATDTERGSQMRIFLDAAVAAWPDIDVVGPQQTGADKRPASKRPSQA